MPPPHQQPTKKPPPPPPPPDIKRRILTLLDKLSDRDTFTQASTELNILAQHLTPDTTLTPFLTCLLSIDSSSNHKPAARAHSLRLISTLASHHSISLTPHLNKILSFYIPRRLRDSDTSIRSACIEAISSISHNLTTSTPFNTILDPLYSAMSTEQDLNVQIGAAMCLSAAIDSAPSDTVDINELRRMLPRTVKLVKSDGFKAKPAVWGLIGSVVAAESGTVVNTKGLMSIVTGCAVDSLGSEDWSERKAAAEALERLAISVEQTELLADVKRICLESLEKRRFDKVKNARDAMNRALDAWKEVPGGEDSLFSRSNSSSSKDYSIGAISPPLPKNYLKTPSPPQHKKMTKSRSTLSDSSGTSPFTSTTTTTTSSYSETPPQSKRILSKSRSSLSSLSSFSDESNPTTTTVLKTRSSLPIIRKQRKSIAGSASRKQSVDWKFEIVVPQGGGGYSSSYSSAVERAAEHTEDSCVDEEEEANLDNHDRNKGECDESVTSSDCIMTRSVYDERRRVDDSMSASQEEAVSCEEESEPEVVDVDGVADLDEQVYDSDKKVGGEEVEDLASIRKHLVQIEKQQSTLMNLLQNFMGRSQSGIDSLETRVSGLEKALDKITYGLTVQSGRTSSGNNNTCCMLPAAEFLSPKFWKKNEGGGRFAVPKSMPNTSSDEAAADSWVHEQNEMNPPKSLDTSSKDLGRSRGEVNSPRVQACSGAAAAAGSFTGAFSSTYFKPVVPRT